MLADALGSNDVRKSVHFFLINSLIHIKYIYHSSCQVIISKSYLFLH